MKAIIIGFDAFDPKTFTRLREQGKLPHLTRLAQAGGYAPFEISNPPQSEVSWTSIATGLNPGGHGIFDFVHRNPANYTVHVSLLPTKSGVFGTQFVPPHEARSLFQVAVEQGYPATSLWWPATFPARLDSAVRTIPGLGTPDILGRLGAGHAFSPDGSLSQDDYKTRLGRLEQLGRGRYRGALNGPLQKKGSDTTQVTVEFEVELADDDQGRLRIGRQEVPLMRGAWSPFLQLAFRVKWGMTVHALTRATLSTHPDGPGVYFLPLQIDPLRSTWPYAHPKGFVKQAWETGGPFLTLGWPQDTTGLEEGFFSDEAFLELCGSIQASREQVFLHSLSSFEEGVLAVVFDSLDRIQHMFWRDRPDVVEGWYEKLDALFGRLQEGIDGASTRLLVVSDHGFTAFDQKVHLNRWLLEQGYLALEEGRPGNSLLDLDWGKTRLYAIGLNSVYFNLAGRERDGIVQEDERETLLAEVQAKLAAWTGPDGRRVVGRTWTAEQAFEGPQSPYAPDLVVGYASGFRASAETGLGGVGADSLEQNQDHWGADHCINPEVVPGVLFSNRSLAEYPAPSYRHIPELALGRPIDPHASASQKTPQFSDEDREVLEERLKDLGYL